MGRLISIRSGGRTGRADRVTPLPPAGDRAFGPQQGPHRAWGRNGHGRGCRTARSPPGSSCRRVRSSTNTMSTPLALSSASSRSSTSAAVTSMSVIASHWSTTHRGPAPARGGEPSGENGRRWRRTAGPPSGRRRCREPAAPGVGVELCQPSTTVPAEHLAGGPPAPLEEQQDREPDGDEDALEHPQEHHAEHGGERQQRTRRSADAEVAAQVPRSISDSAAPITTAARAVWGRFASRSWRNEQHRRDRCGAHQPGHLALGARLLGNRRARAARRDGEALEETGGDVAGPIPIISWLGSTSSPRRAAKLVEVAIVSVERHERDSDRGRRTAGRCRSRSIRGKAAARAVPAAARRPSRRLPRQVESDTRSVAPTTATSTAGIARVKRGRTSIRASDARPTPSRRCSSRRGR